MKFLIIASYPRSVIHFRGTLLKALLGAGFEVHVACPGLSGDSDTRQELKRWGVVTHDLKMQRTGLNPLSDIQSVLGLYSLISKVKPSYILAYTIKPVIYGLLAAWLNRVPNRVALITGLGYAFQNEGEGHARACLRILVQKLYAFALRCSHLTFFQNPDDEMLFRRSGLLARSARSLVVNGSGIPVDQFNVVPLPTEPRFLLIARLIGNKGVREYFEAAKRIKHSYPSAVFKLVGWIDENPDAISNQELNTWISSGVIEYLGRLDDVRPAIESSSVYVLPSYREGTPRTVLEAMAMGRAIITTDAPGCRETVTNGDNGFLVPIKSIDCLASAMEQFIINPGLAVQMGRRSHEIAVEKYDVNKVNNIMLRAMGVQ